MKICRSFLAVPFMIVCVWAAPAANDLVLPEKIFPQLDEILKTAVQQSPRMLNRALDLEIAENNRIAARSSLLPTLSASYSYYKSQDRTKYLFLDDSHLRIGHLQQGGAVERPACQRSFGDGTST